MARNDLDEGPLRRLTAAALAAHPSPGRFAALAVGPDDPMADVARTVERALAPADFSEHEQSSLFLLVMDRRTGLPAGIGRVIDGGGRTLDEAPAHIGRDLSRIVAAHGLHDGKIWDVATISSLPAYRRGRTRQTVGSLLYRTFLNAGRRAGVRHVVALLDHRAQRHMALLGTRFVPMAASGPFAYLGSPSTRALYHSFADLEPYIAEQSTRLKRPGSTFAGELPARGLRRLFARRAAARITAQISSGRGLDEHILLPGLDRRRLVSGR